MSALGCRIALFHIDMWEAALDRASGQIESSCVPPVFTCANMRRSNTSLEHSTRYLRGAKPPAGMLGVPYFELPQEGVNLTSRAPRAAGCVRSPLANKI